MWYGHGKMAFVLRRPHRHWCGDLVKATNARSDLQLDQGLIYKTEKVTPYQIEPGLVLQGLGQDW